MIFINCEDIYHANVIFRTGPWVTYLFLAGNLVPRASRLTPAIGHVKTY